ncbi:polysaccharide deacetylase family protein [Haloglycomyces albus]|uniref:polysaccharide deacetylase family protein n=1 Tax=Haloglycomyces albus TaxID=526067 RepID=UPI00046D3F4B|nr:polysaccharide deacetylase family protein [Haloglycomyces albus]
MTSFPSRSQRVWFGLLSSCLIALTACQDATPNETDAAESGDPIRSTEPDPSPSPEPSPTPGRFDDRIPDFDDPPANPTTGHVPSDDAPLYFSIPTDDPVAFITIDDGWVQNPDAIELLAEADVPNTLFLLGPVAEDHPEYFAEIAETGATIHPHTDSHRSLPDLDYTEQKREICSSSETLAELYDIRPRLFRPPFGEYDDDTLRAAAECGMDAVLHWRQAVKDGTVHFQEGDTVQPGDIILMHFRDEFVDDYIAALEAIDEAGLTPALLDDYIPSE